MRKRLSKRKNIKTWKKGLGVKAINISNTGNGTRKGLILT